MILISSISVGIFSLYAVFMLYFLSGLIRLRKTPLQKNFKEPTVSVVIAARNEEENIGNLLEDLIHQTYPREKLQIIIADDRSTDKTIK
jgi:cellulose synthase/poly-beta-1,6-N-acetylglucosamine synthase-like glycosyltransferase